MVGTFASFPAARPKRESVRRALVCRRGLLGQEGVRTSDDEVTTMTRSQTTTSREGGAWQSRRQVEVVLPSGLVVVSGVLVAGLAAVAALTGLLWTVESDTTTVTSVYGEQVELYGKGLYRHDSVFKGAGNRGADLVTIILAVPVLLWSLLHYRRRSLRAALIGSGALTWFLYVYVSTALGSAYNELLLVYIAIVASAAVALARLAASIDLDTVHDRSSTSVPYVALSRLLAVAGLVTAVVWLIPLVGAVIAGEAPEFLDHYTTSVTYVLDLAFITPAVLTAAVLAHRHHPTTVMMAMPLLGLLISLLPMIAAQTWFQVDAGYDFTPGEIIGPMAGFVILVPVALAVTVRLLRAVDPSS